MKYKNIYLGGFFYENPTKEDFEKHNIKLGENVIIEAGAKIGAAVKIEDDVKIEKGAEIKKGSQIKKGIIGAGITISV